MPIAQGTPYAGVAASPAYSGAAAGGVFIPEIWSGKLIEKFYAATVLAAIANTDYEGEIKNQGDMVHIRTKPTITIRDYRSTRTAGRPASADIVDLTIDNAKYFNEALDDIMEIQADINLLSMWSDDASEQMKIVIDTAVLTSIDAGVVAANKGATAGNISANINLGAAGAPVILTPLTSSTASSTWAECWTSRTSRKPGAGWSSRHGSGADQEVRPAQRDDLGRRRVAGAQRTLGMIDRFTLYSSNLLPTATEGAPTRSGSSAGIRAGLTFAPDHPAGKDAIRAYVRHAVARPAGVRRQGARRHGAGRPLHRAHRKSSSTTVVGDFKLPHYRCSTRR